MEVQYSFTEMEFCMFTKIRTSMFATALLAASVFGSSNALAAENAPATDVIVICDANLCVIVVL